MNIEGEAGTLSATSNESETPTGAGNGENVEPNARNSAPRESAVRKLVGRTRIKAAGTLLGSVLTTLVLLHEAGGTVQPVLGDPRQDIEAVIEGHYEAVGAQDFEKFTDHSGQSEGTRYATRTSGSRSR